MNAVFLVLFGIVVDITSALYAGFVTMKLWNWFIPSITHLNPITYANACGFGILVSFLTNKYIKREANSEEIFGLWLYNMIYPTCALGMAYLFT